MLVRILKSLEECEKCDVAVVPFGIVGEIVFKKQIEGDALELINLGKLSLKTGGILLVGAPSDNYGVKKRSVFAFEKGRLISVCDMNCDEQGFSPSSGYKIVGKEGAKIGVLVDKDLFLTDAVFALRSCGCCAIIDLYADFCNRKARVSAEFYAFCHGVNFLLAAQNEACAFDSFGNRILSGAGGEIVLPKLKACKEVRVKLRGAGR